MMGLLRVLPDDYFYISSLEDLAEALWTLGFSCLPLKKNQLFILVLF